LPDHIYTIVLGVHSLANGTFKIKVEESTRTFLQRKKRHADMASH